MGNVRYSPRGTSPVWLLIGINVVVFIATTFNPDLTGTLAFVKWTNQDPWAYLAQYPYTVISSIFVHANIWHILFNMLVLYFFGIFLLQLIESKWFYLIYFIGGIAGNLLFIVLGPPLTPVVGASGAIYTIMGALLVMRPNVRVLFFFFIPMPLWVAIIIGFILTIFPGGGNIAWQAHLGGIIVGIIAGLFFRRQERERMRSPYYRWR